MNNLTLSEESLKARSVAGNLVSVLHCDYILTLKFKSKNIDDNKKEYHNIQDILAKGLKDKVTVVWENWRKNKFLDIGYQMTEEEDGYSSNNIIIGPLGELKVEAEEFRQLWGPKCQLRRFLDGSIREAVSIELIDYKIPSMIKHLIQVHFIHIKVDSSKFNLFSSLPKEMHFNKHLKDIRSIYSDFTKLLRSLDISSLPIRSIKVNGSALHYGGNTDVYRSHFVSENCKVASISSEDFICRLKSGSKIAPSTTKAINVLLSITSKRNLNDELFSKLRLSYLLSMSEKLKGLPTMIRDNDLFVNFRNFLFRVHVQSPLKANSISDSNDNSISELFYHCSLKYSSWSSSCHLIRRWISGKFLDYAFPEIIIDLLLALVYSNKLTAQTQIPKTVEAAVVRFFDFLAFTDFETSPYLINDDQLIDEDQIQKYKKAFFENRNSFPPLAILTQYDGPTKMSRFTFELSKMNLIRLINLSRQTLHSLMKHPQKYVDFRTFDALCTLHSSQFDICIHLKSLQIPRVKTRPQNESASKSKKRPFPIVDYNPLECYLEELKASYGHMAQFYYNSILGNMIGVKIIETKDSTWIGKRWDGNSYVRNYEAMLDDFKILGTGLVKSVDVESNFMN